MKYGLLAQQIVVQSGRQRSVRNGDVKPVFGGIQFVEIKGAEQLGSEQRAAERAMLFSVYLPTFPTSGVEVRVIDDFLLIYGHGCHDTAVGMTLCSIVEGL